MNELLLKRYSPRAFSEQQVSKDLLEILFDAARKAPSARNEQPWKFIYTDNAQLANYSKFLSFLSESNQLWAQTAPILVAALTGTTYRSNNKHNEYARYDLGQAIAYLTIQATELELYVHQMGGFDREKAHKELNLPTNIEVVVMLAIGYKGELQRIPEEFHEAETNRKTRFLVEQIYKEYH